MSLKARATDRVIAHTGGRVASGPFAGMKIDPHLTSWGDGDVGARLLGIYEQPLHRLMMQFIESDPDCVVTLGCAEGYYTIGLARHLPEARHVAVDISQRALDIVNAHANQNDVEVETHLRLPDIPDGAVWIVDIEGDEQHVLNPETRSELKTATLVVELHPWIQPRVQQILMERFLDTHNVYLIEDSNRSVNRFDFLADLPDEVRWSLAMEGRPQRMSWLVMTPMES